MIGEPFHSGAMGSIFHVTKAGYRQPMIMKVPRVGPNEPTEAIISFETEATIVPTLSGPHVPRSVAVGDLARTPYLVTEWVEGDSLDHIMRARHLGVDEIVKIGIAIADALHDIHEQDVIHLDLKPANVILRPDGVAVLVDFGFAHHARYPDLLAEETRFGAGSAAYVSPEQILGTREDPRSDIFSLGVLLYEMLTGRFPFGEPDTDVRNRLWFDPEPLRTRNEAVEPWLQEVVLRCLDPRVEQRYQSAAHVAFDLRHPEQVVLTSRATKTRQAGLLQQLKRFLHARREHGRRLRLPNVIVSASPVIMVAVDTMHPDDDRHPAIQRATAQILSLSGEFRLICVSVIPGSPAMESASETATGLHLEHIVRLRHWAEPLRMPAQRLSLHVIESPNPGDALLEFARLNHVSMIIVGAPGATQDHSWGRSVASAVTSKARCSVYVVRVPERKRSDDAVAAGKATEAEQQRSAFSF